ncbi:ribonuclease H [Trifolium pratense]|uniref:Ribonuclease H n=1 Tax=Trifolium pratense TaxID=57577 RepID=A0A2K3L570_TRIPR|nr:ribonuclease H [Trifolium pratense]
MGVRHVLGTGNYLGLPSMIGRKKKQIFAFIKDRIWKRINSWRGRALSRAGKEIMIKSVLQAIPSYIMSVYLLPDSTIKDIERMMNSFWWGGGVNNKGIRWLAWDRMTHSKAEGGMGFRDLHSFNLAMIAKQGWNIMTKPNTLLAKLYKARYFPNSSLFESKLGHNPSYAWRGIWKSREILMHGCRWSIGSGASINIMSEPWLRGEDGAWLPSPQVQGVHNFTVNDLMIPNMKLWDKEKIDSIFPLHIANRILATPLLNMVAEDSLVWSDSTHGEYSVKSGYKLLMNVTGKINGGSQQDDWSSLWKICAPPKAKHLLWRISKGCLPTRMRLQEKRVPCPLLCPLCNLHNEDDWHVVLGCDASSQARLSAGLDQFLAPFLLQASSVKELIFAICSGSDKELAGLFAMLVWVLWNNRNNVVWNELQDNGRNLGFKARHMWEEWISVQQLQHGASQNAQQQPIRWQKPDQNWYKCNVDAGFHKELNKTSLGWVLRDDRGRFIMAAIAWMEGNCSILEGEALALLEALKL